ncbi:hypothetical protein DUI87_14335 [Hirundo rustica rustica]|uniref:Uncharacterized protein n=1 Tax=Hirundo rustica rustica TaxID=333673 RepID=A0A3M0KQJ7_HIRRU|nr:hypothetical protein DUI87_14335 [Hirundo rustica rustica]
MQLRGSEAGIDAPSLALRICRAGTKKPAQSPKTSSVQLVGRDDPTKRSPQTGWDPKRFTGRVGRPWHKGAVAAPGSLGVFQVGKGLEQPGRVEDQRRSIFQINSVEQEHPTPLPKPLFNPQERLAGKEVNFTDAFPELKELP